MHAAPYIFRALGPDLRKRCESNEGLIFRHCPRLLGHCLKNLGFMDFAILEDNSQYSSVRAILSVALPACLLNGERKDTIALWFLETLRLMLTFSIILHSFVSQLPRLSRPLCKLACSGRM